MHCRLCDKVDMTKVERSVDAYIARIDKEQACDVSTYKQRLSICSNCNKNREGMCGVCGCFVKVRAYKKHMTCPSTTGNKWLLDLVT